MADVADKVDRLRTFKDWTAKHISGDEKGEAQVFIDRLFQAFGWGGLKEAGAICEERVKNTDGGTSFADLVWKPVVVIEMKRRGTDLAKHYSQAFTYWTRLVPNRPRYAILCNFDSFWVYDFETQLDTPVDIVHLSDLPEKYGALNFLFPGDHAPVFGNHQESVTRQAADLLAACFNSLVARGVEQPEAQRFTLQMLMALFAEDIGLLDKYLVTQTLEDCKTPQDTHDLLGGLFDAMNTKGGVKGGRFKGVPYFNGGLFAHPAHLELVAEERSLLKSASQFDWSRVRPEIFGTLFEHSLGKEERHARGAHFTSAVDIMKVVAPTIVEPWTELIESADTLSRLKELLARIEGFTVLDPACGSGNFLYIAYRELKRLEARIYERMAAEYKSVDPRQRPFGFVSTRNFFGMDINPFAIDIAKVTMMLAHKLAIDELHITEAALPLDNLDENFRAADALVNQDGSRAQWFPADVIIGNPPFLGAKFLKPEYGIEYVKRVRAAYPEVPGMADFCVYWFRRAHDELKPCLPHDPVAGRAGLVGTQNIRNNASRRGGLDYIASSGTIVEAVDNQPWSGEAAVHVSIANWVKSKDKAVLPKVRRLWFKVADGKKPKRDKDRPAAKQYELDMRPASFISSSLSDAVDVSQAEALDVNVGYCYTGQYPRFNEGFTIPPSVAAAMIKSDSKNSEVVHLFTGGDELLSTGKAARYVIDFQGKSIVESKAYKQPYARVEELVLPYVQELANKERATTGKSTGQDQGWLNTWWQFFRSRPELIAKIAGMNRFMACSRVTKRPIFMFLASTIRPSDALSCFALDDDYSFGILQSNVHYTWFHAKCSNMKSDPRYTSESVFDTFPWPQTPTESQALAVAAAGVEVRRIRSDAGKKGMSLRALYQTLELPGKNPLKEAHQRLDDAVSKAYGFSSKKDLRSQLLDLNAAVSGAIDAGGNTTGPGVPKGFKDPKRLISSDFLGI